MRKNNVFVFAACLTLMGCGLYNKYEAPLSSTGADTNALFGIDPSIPADAPTRTLSGAVGEASIADMTWREFFTDPLLQQLIEQVLANNTDLNSARIAVEKSQASLKAAKMAYLPSLYFSPQGTLAKFDDNPWSKTYNLPLQLSVDVDVFGSITNKKRASKAVLLQAQMGEETVRTNLISAVAQQYYMLQLLDRQLEILTMTDSLWGASLDTQKSLYENGKAYSTAVNQMESSYLNVKTQIVDTRRNIQATENALCRLMAITPQHIERKNWGSAVINPGKLLLSFVGQLTQPIFARGKLKANLKISKLTQEDLQKKYVQTVIDAGNQVNEAMADCQAAREKYGYYHRQVQVLNEAYRGTHELMDNGKASYLEVLTAQESLLNSQLSEASNMYKGAQAVIALGGGTK